MPTTNDFFQFREAAGIDFSVAKQALHGEILGGVFRRLYPAEICAKVVHNFWRNRLTTSRDDAAPSPTWGAFHYDKPLGDYLNAAAQMSGSQADLFAGTLDVFSAFTKGMGSALADDGVQFRIAQHEGRQASPFVIRAWKGQGEYSLLVHEDMAQLSFPEQAGFEIQRVRLHTVCAFNLCLENSEGGELEVWPVAPTDEDRMALGTTFRGYPYPTDALKDLPSLRLMLHAGDAYILNGGYLHAVRGGNDLAGHRIMLSFFLGIIDKKTVVLWS